MGGGGGVGAAKRRPGRPKLFGEVLSLSISPAQRSRFLAAAELSGHANLADWVRRTLELESRRLFEAEAQRVLHTAPRIDEDGDHAIIDISR